MEKQVRKTKLEREIRESTMIALNSLFQTRGLEVALTRTADIIPPARAGYNIVLRTSEDAAADAPGTIIRQGVTINEAALYLHGMLDGVGAALARTV